MSRTSITLLGLVALFATSGCWGSRAYVVADGAKYPVSMSSAVRGPDGKVLTPDQLETKSSFATDYMTCRMLWTLIPLKPLGGDEDISDAINEQLKAAGGEAIVNLTVESGATVTRRAAARSRAAHAVDDHVLEVEAEEAVGVISGKR